MELIVVPKEDLNQLIQNTIEKSLDKYSLINIKLIFTASNHPIIVS